MSKSGDSGDDFAEHLYKQGKADEDHNPLCRNLVEHVETDIASSVDKPRLTLLASTIHEWLGWKARSSLRNLSVAEKHGRDYRMVTVFSGDEGEKGKDSAFSRWINQGGPWPFSEATARRLLSCCIQQKFWAPGLGRSDTRSLFRHEFYHQLVEQLDSNATTRSNLVSEAPGVYQCFRPSVAYPGRFVFGLFAVALMEDGPRSMREVTRLAGRGNETIQVLRTIELHRMNQASSGQPEQGLAADSGPSSASGSLSKTLVYGPNVEEIFRGYMVKKSRQVLVHAFDAVTSSFQYSVITNFLLSEPFQTDEEKKTHIPRREAAKIQMMSGIAVGVVGQLGFYSVPTVLIRVEDDSENVYQNDGQIVEKLRNNLAYESLGMITEAELPDFVKKQFQIIERQVVLRSSEEMP